MASTKRPDEARQSGNGDKVEIGNGDLDRRRKALDSALAARRPVVNGDNGGNNTGTVAGVGNALKLSSEFIAAVIVGVGLGWFIDRMAGTSPWGLIIFLLLGFAAGVVNVLRSAGLVAEVGTGSPKRVPDDRDGK